MSLRERSKGQAMSRPANSEPKLTDSNRQELIRKPPRPRAHRAMRSTISANSVGTRSAIETRGAKNVRIVISTARHLLVDVGVLCFLRVDLLDLPDLRGHLP